jgi:CO/xanthine dehydrogenase FAD-binding subunit
MHTSFDLEMPDQLDSALALLAAAADAGTAALAGGTNLIVDIRAGRFRPHRLVALGRISALRGIAIEGDNVRIGGRTTVSELLESPIIAANAPALVASARVFGGQMVRNTATVAGNIACGSPAADLVPPLLALDARVTLASRSGTRTIALADYFGGYKQDVRRPDELIVAITWPRPKPVTDMSFYKLGRRKGDAITITGAAVTLAAEQGRCVKARIALGAVAPFVFRARKAEAMLEGQPLTAALAEAAAAQAASEASPIDDIRASAEYRRHTVNVLTRRLVWNGWQRLNGAAR